MLDPDPDPYKMNKDPKPWWKTSSIFLAPDFLIFINYIYLPNRQPGDRIGNVCAARQAVTGVQSLARVAGQRGVSRELMHRKYVLVLGLQVVDHA
jgi:hypothetical protein